jgi:hypothetical protein
MSAIGCKADTKALAQWRQLMTQSGRASKGLEIDSARVSPFERQVCELHRIITMPVESAPKYR